MRAWTRWLSYRHWSRKKGAKQISILFGEITAVQLDLPVELGIFSSQLADCPLKKHIEHLEAEFVGQPNLVLHHALLIVLIRREVDVQRHFAEFEQLWADHQVNLLKKLDLRWLVSAADTLIDHHPDLVVRSNMIGLVMLVNTIKLYETEISQLSGEGLLKLVGAPKFELFDGLSSFKVGEDDTLYNQSVRFNTLSAGSTYHQLTSEVFLRINCHEDTAYGRALKLHQKTRTKWIDYVS